MKKGSILISILLLCFLPIVFASSIDDEIQKVTHYAEEYETGNINYAQLSIYLSAIRQNLNEIAGTLEKEDGGVLEQEKIRSLIGEPQEETKWVWIENEQREKRLDEYIPVWRKIVFDGNKIQIILSAYPSLYKIQSSELKKRIWDLEEQGNYEEAQKLKESEGEEVLVYRLNFERNFKQKATFNVQTGIASVKKLAEVFQNDPSKSNAEALAEESVNVEKAFGESYKQSAEKCEDLMLSIFESQNLRGTTGMINYEVTLYEEEKLEAILRLEMCDECDSNWINLNLWIDSRGDFRIEDKKEQGTNNKEKYISMTDSQIEEEITKTFNLIVDSLKQREFSKALSYSQELNTLNQAWNENSKDFWREVDESMKNVENSMTDEERRAYQDNYGWIKREQEKQEKVKELTEKDFENKKEFYFNLISGYEKRESYVKQTEYEIRLLEEIITRSEEKCDNNADDNNNGQIDCSDSVCNGQFCGTVSSNSLVDNKTVEEKINLYCIASKCQQRSEEKIINESMQSICGNNICENGETQNCAKDCANCTLWDAIPCEGKLVFSGTDKQGCELEPICVKNDLTCTVSTDCEASLCGKADCIEGLCQVVELGECREAECVDGDEKVISCGEEKLTKEVCINGIWKDTGVSCATNVQEAVKVEKEIVGNQCVTKEDCGGTNDVCSNGLCVTLPEVQKEELATEVEIDEIKDTSGEEKTSNEELKETNEEKSVDEETSSTENSEEKTETNEEPEEKVESIVEGGIVNAILGIIGRITGFVGEEENTDTGSESNSETNSNSDSSSESTQTEGSNGNSNSEEGSGSGQESNNEIKVEGDENNNNAEYNNNNNNDNNMEKDNYNEDEKNDWEDEQREREAEEKERKQKECNDRCERECYDKLVRPCTEDCIWKACGKDLVNCDIDATTKNCEESCNKEKDDSCEDECYGKCIKNENTWVQPEAKTWEEEVGVFNLNGGCRQEQGKTNSYLWFGGWGKPFDEVQQLKEKYYQGGKSDWCEIELENAKIQRKELEKSFNQEFIVWFFEKHLANSAGNWQQASSGIFELYYDGSMRSSEEIARSMTCLGLKEIPFEYELINLSYETEYGRIEYWEETEKVNLDKMGDGEEIEVISPYMKAWIFPSKEFMKYELKKSMAEHRFPGASNENEGNGPNEEEKAMIKQNKEFMKKIGEIVSNYEGNLDGVIQIKDETNEEIIFNLYVQVNEEDILTIEPMLPEEVKSQDVKVIINFEDLYSLIYTSEKDMKKDSVESPYWSKKKVGPGKIKEIGNGLKMASEVRKIINNAEISPESSNKDVKKLINLILNMMMDEGDKPSDSKEQSASFNGEKEGNETSKEESSSMNEKAVKKF